MILVLITAISLVAFGMAFYAVASERDLRRSHRANRRALGDAMRAVKRYAHKDGRCRIRSEYNDEGLRT